MPYQSIVLASLFALTSIVCFVSTFRTNRITTKSVRFYFRSLLVLCGFWALSVSVQLLAPERLKITMFMFGLMFGLSAVFAWILFVLEYTGSDIHRKKRFQYGTLAIFILILSVKITNVVHGQYFTYQIVSDPFTHLSVNRGLIHHIVMSGSYLVSFYGFARMYKMYDNSQYDTLYLRILLLVMFIPGIIEVSSYVFRDIFILSLPHEPLGVAVFAVGSLFLLNDTFSNIEKSSRMNLLEELMMPTVLVVEDQIVSCNSTASKIILNSNLPPVDVSESDEQFRDTLKGENTDNIETTIKGNKTIYSPKSSEISIGDNEIGRSYIFADITDVELNRRALQGQKEQLEQLANESRHYMRNQVGIINGNIEILQEESQIDNRDIVERTERATSKLSKISENISTIITMSNPVMDSETISIEDMAKRVESDRRYDLQVESGYIKGKDNRIRRLFREFLLYAGETDATNVWIYEERGDLIMSHNDCSKYIQDVTTAGFEHGEIESKYMSLNIVKAVADGHAWSYNVECGEDETKIVFENVSSD